MPIRWSASAASPAPATAPAAISDRAAPRAPPCGRAAAGSFGSSDGRRFGRTRGPGSVGTAPSALRGAGHAAVRLGHAERLLVHRLDLARPRAATRSARRARARPRAISARRSGSERELEQRLAERDRVADRHEHAVRAVRAPRRGSRRCREATTGVPEANASVSTMPKLSPPSDGAHSRSASPSSCHFSASSTWPAISMPSGSSSSGSTSSAVAPATVRRACTPAPRSASKARSSTGRPLRSSARPTKSDLGARRCGRAPSGPRRGQVHAVRDDPVAAAVVALRRPARRLGHGDARAQLGVEAAGADEVGGEPVHEPGWSSRCGRWRPPARCAASVAYQLRYGRVRLVHVDDVVAAVAQLAAEQADRLRGRSRGSTRRRSSAGRACGPAGSRSRAGAVAAGARRGGVTRASRSSGS